MALTEGQIEDFEDRRRAQNCANPHGERHKARRRRDQQKLQRHTVVPGQDASGESEEVQAIVAAMHTDALVADYEASVTE
jgi:hypothetical protein